MSEEIEDVCVFVVDDSYSDGFVVDGELGDGELGDVASDAAVAVVVVVVDDVVVVVVVVVAVVPADSFFCPSYLDHFSLGLVAFPVAWRCQIKRERTTKRLSIPAFC